VECREAAEHFPAFVGQPGLFSGGPASRAVEAHLQGCARCRGELGQYHELNQALATLATRTIEPPAWLLPSLIDSVHGHALRRLRVPSALREAPERLADPRLAAAGGALLLAGLAAGAVLVRGRRRRRRSLTTQLRAAALGA